MNPQQDYYNFALRYLETTNHILRQLDNVNRNLYFLMNGNRNSFGSTNRNYMNRNNRINSTNPNNVWGTSYYNSTNTTPVFNNLASQLLNPSFWDTVVIYPSQQEIENATSIVTLADLPPGTTNCPITMERFNSESEILRINHCGHVFTRDSILRWFRNHVSCPVCRYDIRQRSNNTSGATGATGATEDTENENVTNSAANSGDSDNSTNGASADAGENEGEGTSEANENQNTQVYQFDFTLGGGGSTDILNNVINGLSNMSINNDLGLATPQVFRTGNTRRRTYNSNSNSNGSNYNHTRYQ